MTISGRNALITGGAGGLGTAMSRALAAAGVNVVLHYRADRARAEALAAELTGQGVAAVAVQGDLATHEGPRTLARAAEASLGPIDILVNNAGGWVEKPVLATTDDEWDHLMELDLRGPYLLIRAVAPGMLDRGWGRIVNISSVASLDYVPGEGLYGIAKAGINMLTKSLGVELGGRGVTVNAIAPAWTIPHDQPFPVPADYPQCHDVPNGRPGHATEVGALLAFLVSEPATHINAQVLPIDGGLSVRAFKGR